MENEKRDEIIEELWNVKDKFSDSCNRNMEQIVEKINKIAEDIGFKDNQIKQLNKAKVT